MIDLHSHILPGLDDGAQTMDEALKMASIAEEDGIEKIVATPHLFRNDFTPQDLGIIEEKRREFVKALEKDNVQIKILVGAEVHISHNLIDEIRKNRTYLVIDRSSYMFVEFPSEHVFSGVKNLFFELMSEGIRPIIAHPERNSVFRRNPAVLYELVQMGAFCQVNSGSITGIYSVKSQEAANHFLDLGLVHFIASDCHNSSSIPPKLSEAVEKAAEIIGEKNASALVIDNPQAVLDNKDIAYFPNPVNPQEQKRSFHIKIPSIFWRKK